jgi:hypothetical protein
MYLFFIRQFQIRKAKTIFKRKAQSRNKVRMIRLRRLVDVDNYLRQLKVKRQKKKANNREGWASLVKEDKIIILFRRVLIVLKLSSILCLRNS